jgi:hypothetical protein
LFATNVVDTGGNPTSLTQVANFSQVSLTLVANLPPAANFAASVADISGKFATGVVDTGGSP